MKAENRSETQPVPPSRDRKLWGCVIPKASARFGAYSYAVHMSLQDLGIKLN